MQICTGTAYVLQPVTDSIMACRRSLFGQCEQAVFSCCFWVFRIAEYLPVLPWGGHRPGRQTPTKELPQLGIGIADCNAAFREARVKVSCSFTARRSLNQSSDVYFSRWGWTLVRDASGCGRPWILAVEPGTKVDSSIVAKSVVR